MTTVADLEEVSKIDEFCINMVSHKIILGRKQIRCIMACYYSRCSPRYRFEPPSTFNGKVITVSELEDTMEEG